MWASKELTRLNIILVQGYFGVTAFVSIILLVVLRARSLKKQGMEAIEFGKTHKRDLFLPPFALFYLYLITANAFKLPTIQGQKLFYSELVAWIGVLTCAFALFIFLWALISFKQSFRVGLVENRSQGLITTGAFAISRNPIYLSFGIMLVGQFMIYPSWILLMYIFAGMISFHTQVLKEESFLKEQYGKDFDAYSEKVSRYF